MAFSIPSIDYVKFRLEKDIKKLLKSRSQENLFVFVGKFFVKFTLKRSYEKYLASKF